MKRQDRADVLIVGGGPSGLLLGSKLATRFKTVLVEQNTLGNTSKFWLTTPDRLKLHNLENSVIFTTRRGTVGSFLGAKAVAKGDYSVVDEKHLLKTLADRCTESGAELYERQKLNHIHWHRTHLEVHCSSIVLKTRLLIDASGGASPVASTFRLHKLLGFYSIYGAHLDGIRLQSNDIIGAHVIKLGFPPPMFEVIPTSNNSAFCVLFQASARLVEPQTLKMDFEAHCEDNPFFSLTEKKSTIEGKMGAIPIGRVSRRKLPGILPFGESSMIQSPLLGTAFNEVLEHCDGVARAVKRALEDRSGELPYMEIKYPILKTLNDRLQLFMVKRLVDGTTEDFEALVEVLRRIGPRRSYQLFCTRLRWCDLAATFLALGRAQGGRSI